MRIKLTYIGFNDDCLIDIFSFLGIFIAVWMIRNYLMMKRLNFVLTFVIILNFQ